VLRPARRSVGLLGPAFVAAIAYVDPGNVATNTAAGARYGYLLLWVVVVANLVACLVQYLSAKLGLVTGQSLPEVVRERLDAHGRGKATRIVYWAQAEVVAMATDLAEVLGGAIALGLLFDLPLFLGGLITGVVSTVVLLIGDRRGQRRFEQVVTTMLVVLGIGFIAGLFVAPPDPAGLIAGLVPRFTDAGSVLLAAGVLGATVMPHAVYLHSALARDRHGRTDPGPGRRRLLRVTRVDVVLALLFAGAVNAAMMMLGATTLQVADAESLEGVYAALGVTVGPVVATLFAVALLLSGLASTSVGCYAGSVIMDGLLRVRVPLLARRVVTMIPALILLATDADPTLALILSQVVLSFGIPFAIVPLVLLTASRTVMGEDRNHPAVTAVAIAIAVGIVGLNAVLIVLTVTGG
jgi:manganese transport protein